MQAPIGQIRISFLDVTILSVTNVALFFALGASGIGFGTGQGVIGSIALQAAVQVALLWFILGLWRGMDWAEIGFRPLPPGWVTKSLLIGVGMIIVVAPINLVVQSLLGGVRENPQIGAIQPTGDTMAMMATMIVLTAVVIPAIEETLFRGVLYRWLRGFASIGMAVALSSLVFASAHGIVHLMPALLVLGVVLSWSYERTGSLWAPIIIHGAFNGLMMVILYGALSAIA